MNFAEFFLPFACFRQILQKLKATQSARQHITWLFVLQEQSCVIAIYYSQVAGLLLRVGAVDMHDIEILLHVKPVRASTAVDLVAAVVHGKAH